jgi:16S rRNA (cytosine1402-N4)-methyltransferase
VHESVLLAESIELLNVRPDGVYVDCTFGRGGHTREILRNLGGQGRVLAIDRDPTAIGASEEFRDDGRLELVQDRFSRLEQILESRQLGEKIDGILMDLGVSSPQLDDAARGFSFRFDGPLDMRMDPSVGTSAAHWIASASESEIRDCLWELGEERHGRRIARKIVECRSQEPISTTLKLVAVIKRAVPGGYSRIHPATRTFQAIRLKVNSELEELERVLRQAADNIRVRGRVVAVSFHSLEDRMVKRYFRNLVRGPDSLLPQSNVEKFRLLTRKPVRPQDAELNQNPRARSARLRVLERVA